VSVSQQAVAQRFGRFDEGQPQLLEPPGLSRCRWSHWSSGLIAINVDAGRATAPRRVAEVDAALLIDDLPLSAYADPGFIAVPEDQPWQPR
jgi:hypothetical protein